MKPTLRAGFRPTILGTSLPVAIRHLAWLAPLVCACNASALTWNVGGASDNWNTTDANWTGGGPAWTNGTNAATSLQAIFGGTDGEAITVSSGIAAKQITFNNTGTAYNLSGGTITLHTAGDPVINATVDATINSNITISGAQTWAVASGKTLTLGGNINAAAANTDMGFAGKGSYIINGSIGNVRTVYLNGASGDTTNVTFTQANTFTGNLWLGYVAGSSTTLNFSDVNQLGSGTGTNFIAIQNAATLNYTGTGSQSVTGRDLFWNAGTATISVANANANLTLGATGGTRNQNFTKTGAGTLTLNSTATITGGTLTVNGGTLVMQAANSGTGTTSVSAGKLLVNNTTGSGTGSGLVSVASGATLGGTGSTAADVNVTGVLAPGDGIQSLATGTVTLNNLSSLAAQIQDTTATGADLLDITGNLAIDAGTVTLDLSKIGSGAWTVGNKITLASYTGAWNNQLLTYLGSDVLDDTQILFDGTLWTFNYNDTLKGNNFASEATGNYVTMTAVPEPAAALLGSLGLLALLRRRRA